MEPKIEVRQITLQAENKRAWRSAHVGNVWFQLVKLKVMFY